MNLFPGFSTRLFLTPTISLIVLATACGSSTPDATAPTAESVVAPTSVKAPTTATDLTEAAPAESTSVLAGVEAAQWSDNVTITVGDGVFRYQSDGIPSHELPDQMLVPTGQPGDEDATFVVADNPVAEAPIDVEIPLNPVYSDEVTLTGLGVIGVAISGARLFNDYENMERTLVAVDDRRRRPVLNRLLPRRHRRQRHARATSRR